VTRGPVLADSGAEKGNILKTSVHLRLRRLALAASLATSLATAAGCGSSLKQVDLYKNGRDKVFLESQVRSGGAAPQGYAHPAAFTEAQVDRMLAAVGVEEYSYFSWRSQGPLFTPDGRATLAPWITNALKRASPDQWVRFSSNQRKAGLVGSAPSLSDGICFVKDGTFNLVLGNINFEPLDAVTPQPVPYALDPRDRFEFPAQRLSVAAGAGAAPPPYVPGDRWLGKGRVNWIVFDPAAFVSTPAGQEPAKASAPPPPAAAPAPAPGDPAERLKRLQDLRDKGLITPEEYEKKRQEILRGL
jgi:hypothetical protein